MSTLPAQTLAPEALAPQQLLRRLGILARKRMGQHFIVSRSAILHILDALALSSTDLVVEVGAGLGALTGFLAATGAQVVAIELDERLCAHLTSQFAQAGNVRIVQADVLKVVPASFLPARTVGYKVVGNLPYYITSAALRHILSWEPLPKLVVVMVQLEVAQRITAGPGGMSLLSLMVQLKGQPSILAQIPPGAFVPAPKVRSAVLKIAPHPQPICSREEEEALFCLARAAFGQKRKALGNSLAGAPALSRERAGALLAAAGIPARARPQELSLEDWLRLARLYLFLLAERV
jgi:16S rRNA (adenine1518-N6/adenine1519-N6)-dimethyltransferase